MAAARLRRTAYLLAMVAGVAVGVGALLLLARYAPVLGDFGRAQVQVLAINGAAALLLLVLIGVQVTLLVRDRRRGRPGARLRTRLVGAPEAIRNAGVSTLRLFMIIGGGLIGIVLFVFGIVRSVIALIPGFRLVSARRKARRTQPPASSSANTDA